MNQKYMGRLIESLNQTAYDGVLVAPSGELKFLLGHSPSVGERFEGLFVKRDGTFFYICPLLSQEEMTEILDPKVVYSWSDGDGYLDTVAEAIKKYGLAGGFIAVNQYTRAFHVLEMEAAGIARFTSGRVLMEEMRIIKDSDEMECLRIASRLADEVFSDLVAFIRPGQTEKVIRDFIRTSFQKRGVSGDGMVALGANASKPHYNRNDAVVQSNDLVLLDYGCTYQGLYSDITRTIFVGDPTPRQRDVYNIVLRANEEAILAIHEGATASEIDRVARKIIEDEGFGPYFLSRLGHGIGYAGHEAPDIKGSNHRKLEKGMAFSIEPGIYLPGEFGVRIEDIILMGPSGVEVLNKATKEIIVV
jgi:Xaa-Pro dipeptidase